MDLVCDLADSCRDEALDLMLALEAGAEDQPDRQTTEILEIGGWPSWIDRRHRVRKLRFWRHSNRESA
jgi:hypothetical protein